MVLDTPFLAEGSNELVGLGQVVSRQSGEQMVVNLVLKSTAEPVDKGLRETVSTNHISRGGDLKLPKVWSVVGVVGGHTIVSQSKHNSQQQSARAGGNHEVHDAVEEGEPSGSTGESEHPDVMKNDSCLLKERVLQSADLHFQSGVLGGSSKSEGNLEGFVQPGKTGKKQDGEVKHVLVGHKELREGGVLSVRAQLSVGLSLLQRPSQHRHCVNVRVSILGHSGRVVKVRNGMVTVVLVLPPLDRVSLHEVAPEDSHEVTILALSEDLVVQEVMGKPTALLKEQSHQQSRDDVQRNGIGESNETDRNTPKHDVGEALVDVETSAGLEHSHHDQLRAKIPVSFDEGELLLVSVSN